MARGDVSPSVLSALRGRYAGLQPSMQKVADVLLTDPVGCAGLTVTELAGRCGVSASTVMRLCHVVGCDGYRELRTRLASEAAVNHARGVRQHPQGDISAGDSVESVVHKIVHTDVQAVEDTVAGLSMHDVLHVVDRILSAHRVLVFGIGASGLVAMDLESKLTRIGLPVRAFSESHAALMSAALLTPADVMVAISHSGTTAEVLDVLKVSNAANAASVAITNGASSPLAHSVDHCLLTAAHESSFRSAATASRLAQLIMVDCVFVAAAQRRQAQSQSALELTLDAIEAHKRG